MNQVHKKLGLLLFSFCLVSICVFVAYYLTIQSPKTPIEHKRDSESQTYVNKSLIEGQKFSEERKLQIIKAKSIAGEKELFDIVKLSQYYSLAGLDGRIGELSTDEKDELEYGYYITFSSISSLEEYAEILQYYDNFNSN